MEALLSTSGELQFVAGEFDEFVTLPLPVSGRPSSSTTSLDVQLEMTRRVIQRVVTVIVVVIGVIGNVFNIAVLTRRWMKSSTNHYLTALAVYDSLYLVLSLTLSVHHYPSVGASPWYVHYRMPVGRPLADVCSNTGVWLTLTFTVERYIGVCFPMKGKVWCTPRRAKYVIVVVCLTALVVTSPEFFEIEVVAARVDPAADHQLNRTAASLALQPTAFGGQRSYRIGYYYANQTLFTFLPLVLLLVFNSLLIRTVMYAAHRRRAMTKGDVAAAPMTSSSSVTSPSSSKSARHQRDQQRITVMLIGVVVVFLVCQLPQAVQKLYHEYLLSSTGPGPIDRDRRTLLMITANYFNLLVMINCSVNFVLYSSFSTKFRTTFRRLFCRSPRGPEVVVLTTDMTVVQTQMDETLLSSSSPGCRRSSPAAAAAAATSGSPTSSSIASFSVTNPQRYRSRSSPQQQQCRSRSPRSISPNRSPTRAPMLGDGRHGNDRFAKNRLSPSNIEMKTFV